MTGISKDFLELPGYQRRLQRISAMTPKDQAVLNTVATDREFASQELRDKIKFAQLAAAKRAREENLKGSQRDYTLRSRMFKHRKDMDEEAARLAEKARKYNKKQGKYALANALGNIGLSTYLGYKARKAGEPTVPETDSTDFVTRMRRFKDPDKNVRTY